MATERGLAGTGFLEAHVQARFDLHIELGTMEGLLVCPTVLGLKQYEKA